MGYETYSISPYVIIGVVFFALAVAFLAAAITVFFRYHIRSLMREKGGSLEQKQIEEIRAKNLGAAQFRGRVDIFEALEKRAKTIRNTSSSLRTSSPIRAVKNPSTQSGGPGTILLRPSAKAPNPNFVIEKNIVFVNTNEVI